MDYTMNDKLNETLQLLKNEKATTKYPRELALAITKLEECILWYGQVKD